MKIGKFEIDHRVVIALFVCILLYLLLNPCVWSLVKWMG